MPERSTSSPGGRLSRPLTDVERLASNATRLRDPEAGLRALTALRGRLDELEELQVANAIDAGSSWSDIARALSISRQAAHKRYATRLAPPDRGRASSTRMLVTTEARRAVALAREEAHALGAAVVGTEHLLLGIIRVETAPASTTLRDMGGLLEDARSAAQPTLVEDSPRPNETEPTHPAWRGLTPYARQVLERSLQEALNRSEGFIGVEHLLLAILRDEHSGAVQTLLRLKIAPDELAARLGAASQPEGQSP